MEPARMSATATATAQAKELEAAANRNLDAIAASVDSVSPPRAQSTNPWHTAYNVGAADQPRIR
jgi:uncharacterized protein YggE